MNSAMTTKRAFQMLENETLWELTERVHALLKRKDIDYAIVGGVAVCLHGYRRNTVDLDLLIRPEDTADVHPPWRPRACIGWPRTTSFARRLACPSSLSSLAKAKDRGNQPSFPIQAMRSM